MKKVNPKKGFLFVISGPSGSGKTTIAQRILKRKKLKKILFKSISFTTRPKRLGERNGQDYFFINLEEFKEKRRKKRILEWTKYLGYYYATPKDLILKQLKQRKNIILCLDIRGALKIKKLYPKNTVTIFLKPPSLEDLKARIKKRSSRIAKEEIRKRLALADQELKLAKLYDYCLINKNLKETVKQLEKIILERIN